MTHSKVDLAIKGAIAALLVALAAVIVWSMQQHIVHVGDQAKNFTLTADNGQQVSLQQYRGKVVVLNFWAAWCPPCVEEAPSLNEFAKTFESSGVVVLGVSVDRNAQMYDNFLKRFHIAYPTVRDPDENSSYRYGTYQIPGKLHHRPQRQGGAEVRRPAGARRPADSLDRSPVGELS